MYTIISPSKGQRFEEGEEEIKISSLDNVGELTKVKKLSTVPEWNKQSKLLAEVMKKFTAKELGELMKISSKLAELNFKRFQKWNGDYDKNKNVYAPAIVAFLGDVYKGFDLESWKASDYIYAHNHLGIISGLYGLISPLNYIQPYRLEMGTRISFSTAENKEYKNLYDFWGELLTAKLANILKDEQVLINLASVEYSKVIDRKKLAEAGGVSIIDVDFKISKINKKTGKREEKVIAIYAKRARGIMANWIVKNKLTLSSPKNLEKFQEDGWKFKKWSDPDKLGNRRILFVKNIAQEK